MHPTLTHICVAPLSSAGKSSCRYFPTGVFMVITTPFSTGTALNSKKQCLALSGQGKSNKYLTSFLVFEGSEMICTSFKGSTLYIPYQVVIKSASERTAKTWKMFDWILTVALVKKSEPPPLLSMRTSADSRTATHIGLCISSMQV